MTPTLLIVDDEKTTREGLRAALEDHFDVYLAEDARAATDLLEKEHFDVLLTDFKLPNEDGMKLIVRAKSLSRPPICILMTAYGSEEVAVEAMKQGADDYIAKGRMQIDELELRITRALRRQNLEVENVSLRQQLDAKFGLENLTGESPAMKDVFELVQQVAPARTTVLLQGESGTGKEVFARALHRLSGRTGQFVAVNCAAIPESLVESELFGHERGAFTGAIARTDGRFQQADTGTLLLDEVGELPLGMQAKLLRALQESEVQRVGSAQSQRVDVRVVAATNRDLEAEVQAGRFRADLFYRLHVIALELPPLRARGEDIPGLAMHFLRRFAVQNGKAVTAIAPDAMAALQAWTWPGNVRELENAMERAVVLARTEIITLAELPERIARVETEGPSRVLHIAVGTPLEEVERLLITETLRLTGGDKRRAAGLLGMAVRTLYRRLDEFGGTRTDDDTSDETTES